MSCESPHTAARMVALLTKLGRVIDQRVTIIQVKVFRCGCTRMQTVGRVITDEQLQKINARVA